MKNSNFCCSFKLLHLLVISLISCASLFPTLIFAANASEQLVFDRLQNDPVAKRFRFAHNLDASASGQFNDKQLRNILQTIPVANEDIWIVDLRQESHGFIDGIPVCWIVDSNSANAGKSAIQIARDEQVALLALKKEQNIVVFEQKVFVDGRLAAHNPNFLSPNSIVSEHELVRLNNTNYERFYVQDHNKPSDYEVEHFLNFVQQLETGAWLHFHCRGGCGRASTFVVMYDILHNAKSSSLADILERQAQAGNIALDIMPETPDKIWKLEPAQLRYIFLQQFYAYVQDPNGLGVTSWVAWQKSLPS